MIPHTRQQWRGFLVWISNPYQRKMRGNPESRLFYQLKCTVRQSFLQLKASNKVLPLYIKRYCGLDSVTMLSNHAGLRYKVGRFYDQGKGNAMRFFT